MFVGHYAAALGLKRAEGRLSLGVLFLAVQLVDVAFFPFVKAGIERMRIVPHFTASTHFELTYMPWTHSLVGSLAWALATAGLAWWLAGAVPHRTRIAVVTGCAVFSHWLLDLPVHTPDLPLLTDASPKLGLGLWRYAALTYALEAALLLGGLWIYMRATRPRREGVAARYGVPALVGLLLLADVPNVFGPPPSGFDEVFYTAMGAYLGFALIAWLLDRLRRPAAAA